MGTPAGSCHAASIDGHCEAGAVNRPFGCAALAPVCFPISGVHRSPRQSVHSAGGSSVIPSHHTPPSGVIATFVKMVFRLSDVIAVRFVSALAPLATAKNHHS